MEYSDRLRFQPLMENRYPQLATLRQKKGGHFERLPNSRSSANGARIIQSLLLRRKETGEQNHPSTLSPASGNFQELQALHPHGWQNSPKDPTAILQPAAPRQNLYAHLQLLPLRQTRRREGQLMEATGA